MSKCCCFNEQVGRVWLECYHGSQKQKYEHGKNGLVRKAALYDAYAGLYLQRQCAPTVVFTDCELDHLITCGEKEKAILEATAGRSTDSAVGDAQDVATVIADIFDTDGTNNAFVMCGWDVAYAAVATDTAEGQVELTIDFNSRVCPVVDQIVINYDLPPNACAGDIVKPEFSKTEVIADGYSFKVCAPCLEASTTDSGGSIVTTWTALGNVEATCSSYVRDFVTKDCIC